MYGNSSLSRRGSRGRRSTNPAKAASVVYKYLHNSEKNQKRAIRNKAEKLTIFNDGALFSTFVGRSRQL